MFIDNTDAIVFSLLVTALFVAGGIWIVRTRAQNSMPGRLLAFNPRDKTIMALLDTIAAQTAQLETVAASTMARLDDLKTQMATSQTALNAALADLATLKAQLDAAGLDSAAADALAARIKAVADALAAKIA